MCPPTFYSVKFLKKFVPFHGMSDVIELPLDPVSVFAVLSLAHLSGLIQYNQGRPNYGELRLIHKGCPLRAYRSPRCFFLLYPNLCRMC